MRMFESINEFGFTNKLNRPIKMKKHNCTVKN